MKLRLSKHGALIVNTGKHTARAAADKFIVQEQSTNDKIWWGVYNRPFSSEKFNQIDGKSSGIFARVKNYLFRIVTQALILITKCQSESLQKKHGTACLQEICSSQQKTEMNLKSSFLILLLFALPGFKVDPSIDGTRTETGIILNFAQRTAIIANSLYGGEIKKSVFTLLNFLLTFEDVLPMHCSANVGKDR